MKPSFLNASQPFVMGMTLKRTPREAISNIKNCIYAGADAIAVQLCKMETVLWMDDSDGHPKT